MECRETQNLLADYSVDNLNYKLKKQVEAHLGGCAECRAYLAELEAAGRLIETMARVEPPAEIWQTIQLRGEKYFTAPAKQQLGSARWHGAFASAMAAILFFALSVFISLHVFSPKLPQTAAASPEILFYPEQTVATGTMTGYFDQHTATSTHDLMADPVSLGLATITTDQSHPERGK